MGSEEAPRVVIVDGDPEATRALVRALQSGGIEVAGVAGDARAALRAVTRDGPDVILLAASMPPLAISAILDRAHGSRVLAVAGSGDRDGLDRALKAGACGYVLRTAPVRDLVDGIRAAAERRELRAPQALETRAQASRDLPAFDPRVQAAVFGDDDPAA